ncbi:MAG: TIGR02466 family protein [Gammaproteobacteria bacterium]|nr:TIGR02466 family protein [Gammaproteobacteria bacterium]
MKRMAKDFFFPTLVYHTDLPDADSLNASVREGIYAWREEDPEGTLRSNAPATGAWHSATDMHTRAEFNALTREIFEFVQGIYDELGYDSDYEPACDSMWANINPRYGYNRHHTHPHALWSGVYYVQTPENCGLLYLSDPRPQAHVLTAYYDPERRKSESWQEVYYQPIPGRLVAFPGWLVHAVQPNLTELEGREGDRISVSFNFYQVRKGSSFRNPHRNEIVRGDLGE